LGVEKKEGGGEKEVSQVLHFDFDGKEKKARTSLVHKGKRGGRFLSSIAESKKARKKAKSNRGFGCKREGEKKKVGWIYKI